MIIFFNLKKSMGNGNEISRLKKDLDLLDIEEIKLNREMYKIQVKINETSGNRKKVRIKKNYFQITERKLNDLENRGNQDVKKESPNNNYVKINNNNINNIKNELQTETDHERKSSGVIQSEISPKKTSLLSGKSIEKNSLNKEENNNLKSSSIKINNVGGKIILPSIMYNKEEHRKETENIEHSIDENIKEEINNDDINENININKIRKSNNIEKISKISVQPNYNKSMDNKNQSLVDEVEIVGLSEDGVLKDKISEVLVRNSSINNSSSNNNASVSSISKQDKNLISCSESEKKYQNDISDKDEEQKNQNIGEIHLDNRRLLKNNRNKSYFILDESGFSESLSKQSISNDDK